MDIALIVITLLFAFVNGFHDGCNVIATVVTSRSLSPRRALAIACLAEFLGAVVFGTAVAATIGKGILSSERLQVIPNEQIQTILLAALIGAIVWNLVTWFVGLPSSSSHALIGGMVGAGVVAGGLEVVEWHSLLWRVLIPMFASPVIGFVGGYLIMKISMALFRNQKPGISFAFKQLQVATMSFLAASHGSNDAQKAMGIIAMVLFASSTADNRVFDVPYWVVLTCAAAITLGLSMGGWRIIKTIGRQISKITPLHSFDSQVASGSIIAISSVLGFPVSTTQIVGSTVMGVGAGYRLRSVRWRITKDILSAWLLTIPASAIVGMLVALVLRFLGV